MRQPPSSKDDPHDPDRSDLDLTPPTPGSDSSDDFALSTMGTARLGESDDDSLGGTTSRLAPPSVAAMPSASQSEDGER